ncbi:putative zinc finger protein [Luteibacter rhizovicinus]|uniref:Putative zinc finger protein n=1 Tax=Luteibacter rhizovicinus TaxID=242606 RepID=A0A4R3YYW4_9GAMM|nr:zf-HC2 domain-containing protein [Luteibacter rhizovicinus]TCV97826.1 putative zinc finger protein [Luteibacter rhizovicinus]
MTFPTDNGRDCSRAWEAMPWVLLDSAPQEQNEELMAHLSTCESCRAEFAQQDRLRRAVSLPSDIPLDANVGLKRLLARLDAPQEEPVRARQGGWFTRALVAAVLLQAVGLGALGIRLWSEEANPAYRTLSQTAAPVAAGAIHVVPDTNMKVADWDAVLRNLHLQVVGGPNDVGAYTVVATDPASTPEQTLRQLRGTHGIRFAEPVAGTP